ncbi:hypothetical protein EGM51_10615 [Verrucomicrobia bacterium S94]|nr:hypothetical protein EGM51_10615 [Verrucomicrobia bacterium S94]
MMRFFWLMLLCCASSSLSLGAVTNLNYSAADILSALQTGMAVSNAPERLTKLEVFMSDTDGASNILYDTEQIDSALNNLLVNADAPERLDAIDDDLAQSAVGSAGVFSLISSSDVLVSSNEYAYQSIDLSSVVGSNKAFVLLEYEPVARGPFSYSYLSARTPGTVGAVYGGISETTLWTDDGGSYPYIISAITDTNGVIEVSDRWGTGNIRVIGFIGRGNDEAFNNYIAAAGRFWVECGGGDGSDAGGN